jgi:hypothetical protein
MTITAGSIGRRNGTINYSVSQNTGNLRSKTIMIGGSTFMVIQEGSIQGECSI